MGVVRLYLELDEHKVPPSMRPGDYTPIIDVAPHSARELRRRLIRQGYSVIAVPLSPFRLLRQRCQMHISSRHPGRQTGVRSPINRLG